MELLPTAWGPHAPFGQDSALWDAKDLEKQRRWLVPGRNLDRPPWGIKINGPIRGAIEELMSKGQAIEEGSLLWECGLRPRE